jgi:hypothetical protein
LGKAVDVSAPEAPIEWRLMQALGIDGLFELECCQRSSKDLQECQRITADIAALRKQREEAMSLVDKVEKQVVSIDQKISGLCTLREKFMPKSREPQAEEDVFPLLGQCCHNDGSYNYASDLAAPLEGGMDSRAAVLSNEPRSVLRARLEEAQMELHELHQEIASLRHTSARGGIAPPHAYASRGANALPKAASALMEADGTRRVESAWAATARSESAREGVVARASPETIRERGARYIMFFASQSRHLAVLGWRVCSHEAYLAMAPGGRRDMASTCIAAKGGEPARCQSGFGSSQRCSALASGERLF